MKKMSAFENLQNIYFLLIELVFIFIISVIHLVFFFFIKQSDFSNIFDVFESSPLFDFSLEINCGELDHVVFHVWEGREVTGSYYTRGRRRYKRENADAADIAKINWYYFCYKKITYKDLLYNGQIIKKGESCPLEYDKNCGIIDTLEQELCIKTTDNCPLYDVGIGERPDISNYYIYTAPNVYYNREIYNKENKKIIGKIILNEGQPCYKIDEKLWRKFSSDEAGEEHLKCEFEVFDKLNDDRYDNRGDITYQKIYEDNLGLDVYSQVFKDVEDELNNKKVTLYKREFLGIDKACDEKANLSKDNYEKLRENQKDEGLCILIEAIIIFAILLVLIIYIIVVKCRRKPFNYKTLFIFLIICLVLNLICIIVQSFFLGDIIKYNFSYECSDEITNEVSRLENLNTKKSIRYSAANLGVDAFYILFNAFSFLIVILEKKCGNLFCKNKDNKKKDNNVDNTNKIKIRNDNFDKDSVREVIVQKKKPNIYGKSSDRTNNNNDFKDNNDIISKNDDINNKYINPRADLGAPDPGQFLRIN